MADGVAMGTGVGMITQLITSVYSKGLQVGYDLSKDSEIQIKAAKRTLLGSFSEDNDENDRTNKSSRVNEASISVLVKELYYRFFDDVNKNPKVDVLPRNSTAQDRKTTFTKKNIDDLSLILYKDPEYYIINQHIFNNITQASGISNDMAISSSAVAGSLVGYFKNQKGIESSLTPAQELLSSAAASIILVPASDLAINLLAKSPVYGKLTNFCVWASSRIYDKIDYNKLSMSDQLKLDLTVTGYSNPKSVAQAVHNLTFLNKHLEKLSIMSSNLRAQQVAISNIPAPQHMVSNELQINFRNENNDDDDDLGFNRERVRSSLVHTHQALTSNYDFLRRDSRNFVGWLKQFFCSVPPPTNTTDSQLLETATRVVDLENANNGNVDEYDCENPLLHASVQDSSVQDSSVQDSSVQDSSVQAPSVQAPSVQAPSVEKAKNPRISRYGSTTEGGGTHKNKNKNKRHSRRRHKNKRHSRRKNNNKRHSKRRTRK
jgi:hypothetical protein